MDYTRVIKVFLASPMDLSPERKRFFQILDRINNTAGKNLRLQYQIISWENDVLPDKGDDAQHVVNTQIEMDYDIFVCMFRDRLGTPTQRAASGTVEEYQRAILYRCSNPDLRFMCYFFKCENESEDIRSLKTRMSADGVLYMEPEDTEAFENYVFLHFSSLLLKTASQLEDKKEDLSAQPQTRAASVALVTPDNRVLIVKRSAASKYGAGLWQLPGGKVNPGEPPVEAGIREVREELGLCLAPENLKLLHVFHSFFLNDKTRPFDIHLYLCCLDHIPQLQLNEESQCFEWLDLVSLSFDNRRFLGINQELLRVVWQEIGAFGLLREVLDYCRQTGSSAFPLSLPGVSPEKLHALYAMLSVLGFIHPGEDMIPCSPFSMKLLEALVCMSRSGSALFEDTQEDPAAAMKMLPADYAMLRQHRERSLYSHKSLLGLMSCKTELPHSTRHVSNVLIFGSCQGELYMLLRWDFFSGKYQMLGVGLKEAEAMSETDMAKASIYSRFSPYAPRYFDFLPIKSFSTRHFAAGSVDNDPILRQYIVHCSAACVRRESRQDFLAVVNLANSTTNLTLEYSLALSKQQSKDLNFFRWCSVSELLKNRTSYQGRPVRGFEEILSNVGQSDFMRFTQNPLPLTEDLIQDDLSACISKCEQILDTRPIP